MPKYKTLQERLQNNQIFISDSTESENLYELVGEDRLEVHLYYKRRVVEMERKQNVSSLETILLDTIEFVKGKKGKSFNMKNYIKYLSQKCNFPQEKLYSGIQKRRAQRRWAKEDFLKCHGISNR